MFRPNTDKENDELQEIQNQKKKEKENNHRREGEEWEKNVPTGSANGHKVRKSLGREPIGNC